MTGPFRRRARTVAAAVLLLAAPAAALHAQPRSAAEPSLKAAILFNVAKFITWPADALPPGSPLNICVDDDGPLARALQATIGGQTVDGRRVVVVETPADAALPACHLLYINGADRARALAEAGAVARAPVLTVSDAPGFAEGGGVLRLFVDAGRMRMAVNVDAARRAHIQISSRLLQVADVIRDGSHGGEG